jgi:hypothetical protein
MDLNAILVGGVPLAALIVGLVSLAKRWGMPAQYAPWLNGGLAVVGYLLASWIVPTYPAVTPVLETATGAVVIFLVASGVYQFGKIE